MKPLKLHISQERYAASVFRRAYEAALELLRSHKSVDLTVALASQSRAKQNKYHCLIRDISQQVEWDGDSWDEDTWKDLLVEMFEYSLLSDATQDNLNKPGRTLTSLDGLRRVAIRAKTSNFDDDEGGKFIEFCYAQGSEYGVNFSDPALRVYEEYREAHD